MEGCKCKPAKSYAERIIEYKEFVELVKSMREAQEELDVFEDKHDFYDYKSAMKRKELTSKVIKLESEVDEYLKKLNLN